MPADLRDEQLEIKLRILRLAWINLAIELPRLRADGEHASEELDGESVYG